MKLRRPSMGDRMDNAAEKKYRREQHPADLVIEQADYVNYERSVEAARREQENSQPYRGSRDEAEHRSRGR